MTSIGRIWFILAYCHSYWQNMQPINSVLPFCSALPIQYTTHSIAFRATMKFTKGWFQRTDMVCIYSLMECNASRSRFFVIFVVTSERRAIIRHFAKYIDNYSTVNNLLLRAVYCRHVIKLGCEVVPLPESACQSSVLFIGPWLQMTLFWYFCYSSNLCASVSNNDIIGSSCTYVVCLMHCHVICLACRYHWC